jgi:hypothetical protein
VTIEGLESRQLMSAGPANIPNAGPNDAVFDADEKVLHVLFYDTQSKALKYQSFNDDGTASAVDTVDSSGDTGQFLSLAYDYDGVLHAAYYDVTNGDLKYARRDEAGTWTTQTIDSRNTVGLYPSIAIDHDDLPVISYYAKNSGDLKLARFNGSAWTISTISSANDVGRYSSLQVNPNTNKLAVGFEDSTTGANRYAEEQNGWALQTAGTTQIGGGYISLSYIDGRPAMSYYDAFNADLKYAERNSRGKWSSVVVASNNSQGLYTDLAPTFDTGQPAVVYWNKTGDTAVLAYRTPNGVWNFETQLTGGGRNLTAVDGIDHGSGPDLYLIGTDTANGGLFVRTV